MSFAFALGFLLCPAVPALSADPSITAEFAKSTFAKVDEHVRKHFYDSKANATWDAALASRKEGILRSRSLIALDRAINDALHELHASHTEFATPNDEIFFFLKALFSSHGGKQYRNPPKIDYVGAITGGVTTAPHVVRYVLDGSPASAAGVKIGDEILSVNGAPYIGQLSFAGTSRKSVALKVRRAGEELSLAVKPVLRNDYEAYIEATGKSVKRHKLPNGKVIGYFHVWCGGSGDSHDAIEEAIEKLHDTDALIFDIRDGYGGNGTEDLDFFYRPADAYPPFTMTWRNGKKHTTYMTYSKPVVCLINGGSRSGKELLAYSLKHTGRATLVGERTAGAVLGGRLYPINDKAVLYLAVGGVELGGEVIEGKGVAPDVEIKMTSAERGAQDKQYDEAVRILSEKVHTP